MEAMASEQSKCEFEDKFYKEKINQYFHSRSSEKHTNSLSNDI